MGTKPNIINRLLGFTIFFGGAPLTFNPTYHLHYYNEIKQYN